MFDTHAHYDAEQFDKDRDELLQLVHTEGIEYIVNPGIDEDSSIKSIELANKYDFIYAAVGVHPHDAAKASTNYIEKLKELAQSEKVVAIGEIGLDYHYDFSPRQVQKEVLEEQIVLAKELNLPIIFHDREAHEDSLNILKQNKEGISGVMHCFSGSYEMAKEIIDMGMYIGIDGPITFKNAKKIIEVIEKIPLEFILSETDSPYLTPEPYRGKRNDSRYMRYIIEKIAQIKGMSFDETNKILVENGKKLFKIK